MVRSGSAGYMDDGYVPDYHTGRKMSASQYEVIFQGHILHTSSSAKLGKLIHFLTRRRYSQKIPDFENLKVWKLLFVRRFPKAKANWKIADFFLSLDVLKMN